MRRHHRVFYAILLAALAEWILRGRPHGMLQLLGAAVFLAGVVGYRNAGRALGEQLSPLVNPREPTLVIETGPYRRVRHPMYRAELAMALGAPLTLGACVTLLLTGVFAALVLYRMGLEERALAARAESYRHYAARTKRLFPRLY